MAFILLEYYRQQHIATFLPEKCDHGSVCVEQQEKILSSVELATGTNKEVIKLALSELAFAREQLLSVSGVAAGIARETADNLVNPQFFSRARGTPYLRA